MTTKFSAAVPSAVGPKGSCPTGISYVKTTAGGSAGGFANRTLFLGDDSFDSVVDEVKKTGEFSAVDDSVINSLITGKDRVLFLE